MALKSFFFSRMDTGVSLEMLSKKGIWILHGGISALSGFGWHWENSSDINVPFAALARRCRTVSPRGRMLYMSF